MAYLRPYRVAETSTTTGTGNITLAGAVTGYLAFSAELANSDTATIVIEAIDSAGRPTGEWEICDTAFTAPSTLSRGTFRDSSTGSRIDFSAGSKRVFAINPRDVIDLGSADLIGTLGVADGGTGATDAAGARANLSAAVLGTNGDITSLTGLTGGIATADFVDFDIAAAATVTTGRVAWNADLETFTAGLSGAFPLHLGQDVIYFAKNDSGNSIAKGRGVMFAGVVGGSSKLEYTNAVSNGTISHEYIMGLAAQTVANGDFGYVVEFGSVRGFDTTGANKTVPETWAIGDFLYFDPAYPGELTKVQPAAPAWHSPVAVVTTVSASNGSVFVRAKTGETLSELHDVRINGGGPANGQMLIYDATQARWENNTLTAGTGISVNNTAGAVTIANTAPDQTVSLTGAGTTSITGTYPSFTITSNDAFTGTVTSVGGTGTVNGLTLTGTVTGSGNLTLGGTLSGVSLTTQVTGTLPVANGGTGATTLTANNVILGNGTSAVQFVAPGTSGNVLTSNGTTWTSAAAPASLLGDTDSASPFETSLGFEAGLNTTGAYNTFVGYQTGRANTSGDENTAVGRNAFDANTTGQYNTALGSDALGSNTTATDNVAVGYQSLLNNTTARFNTAIGSTSMTANSTGTDNTGLGYRALRFNSVGSDNTAVGSQSLDGNTTGNNNVAIGRETIRSNTTGIQNTAIGSYAGQSGINNLTTGSNNILIGYNAAASSPTVNNETTIGNSSTTSARIFGDVKFLKSYTETVFAVVDAAGAVLDPNNGSIQTWTLGASRTPTQANWAAGQSITLMIDDGSAFTVTWTTLGVVWETNGGTAPTLATTGFTVIVLWKVGTTIYGARVGDA